MHVIPLVSIRVKRKRGFREYVVDGNTFSVTKISSFSDIDSLDRLTHITCLEVSDSDLPVVEGLDALVNLKMLRLNYCNITTLKGLDRLPDLTCLSLEHNRISSLGWIESLVGLEFLFLNYNPLHDIHSLGNLEKLVVLELPFFYSIEGVRDVHVVEHAWDLWQDEKGSTLPSPSSRYTNPCSIFDEPVTIPFVSDSPVSLFLKEKSATAKDIVNVCRILQKQGREK